MILSRRGFSKDYRNAIIFSNDSFEIYNAVAVQKEVIREVNNQGYLACTVDKTVATM